MIHNINNLGCLHLVTSQIYTWLYLNILQTLEKMTIGFEHITGLSVRLALKKIRYSPVTSMKTAVLILMKSWNGYSSLPQLNKMGI